MRKYPPLLLIVALLLPLIFASNPLSAISIKLLAVVNGKPITNLDFNERRNFLIKTTGIEDNDQTRNQIDNDVLQMLIDDILKTEESLRVGRGFSEPARQRAVELTNLSFSLHGEDADSVMERLGISREFAENKFYTDVLWASAVQSRFAQEFANATTEAEKELTRIRANALKPQINLDEIILTPEPNRNYSETLAVAEQMITAIRNGADFGRIAQQYSVSGNRNSGGKIGWLVLDRLPPAIRAAVENIPPGAITNPVEVDGAVIIYRVNGFRRNNIADPLESKVTLGRLVLPIAESDEASREAAMRSVQDDIREVTSCSDLKVIHEGYGSGLDFNFGSFTMGDFSLQLREVLLPLDEDEYSLPINYSEGIVVFMICKKEVPEVNLPSLSEVESTIRNRHFSVLSARYLSQLRRRAVIEYREEK